MRCLFIILNCHQTTIKGKASSPQRAGTQQEQSVCEDSSQCIVADSGIDTVSSLASPLQCGQYSSTASGNGKRVAIIEILVQCLSRCHPGPISLVSYGVMQNV